MKIAQLYFCRSRKCFHSFNLCYFFIFQLNTINQQSLNSLQPEIPVVEDSWQQHQQQQQQQQTHEYEQYQQQGAWQVQSPGDLMQPAEQQPQNGM